MYYGLHWVDRTRKGNKMGALDAVKQAASRTAVATSKAKDKSVFGYLKEYKSQITAALPKHMNADRMVRVATTCIRSTPKLLECTPESLFGAIIQCSQLGLEPGNGLGHAYLLPFEKKKKVDGVWVKDKVEVQLIIGYRGMIDLARRSGQIVSLEAHAVYDGDTFNCQLGLDSKLEHLPNWDSPNRGVADKLKFVYSVAKLKDGGVQFQVMSKRGLEDIRTRSKAANSGPWVSDFEAMALKTVTRRLFKWLPVSIEMQSAVALDERADLGEQNLGQVINGDFKEVQRKMLDSVDPETGEVVAATHVPPAALDQMENEWLAAMDAADQTAQ